uniref:Uncharacterized protein n=1 Tax=Oryza sativa subsp. japonica TaxID=39947 RepID=Q69Q48_ORYSJ|nr:hypothetical protein [Oryza sativa Japonica Group]
MSVRRGGRRRHGDGSVRRRMTAPDVGGGRGRYGTASAAAQITAHDNGAQGAQKAVPTGREEAAQLTGPVWAE